MRGELANGEDEDQKIILLLTTKIKKHRMSCGEWGGDRQNEMIIIKRKE